jgi:hypothetical protein
MPEGKLATYTGLQEIRSVEQFFFTPATAQGLAERVGSNSKVACLSTPTVFDRLTEMGAEPYLFEIDPRFLARVEKDYPGRAVYLDLNAAPTVQTFNGRDYPIHQYHNSFDAVVVDPPFDGVKEERILQMLNYLFDYSPQGQILMIHQLKRFPKLKKLALSYGLELDVIEDFYVDFLNPPYRHVTGTNPISLFSLTYPGLN